MGLSDRRGSGKMEEHERVCVCSRSGPGQVAAKLNVPHLLHTHLKPGIIQTIPEPFQ